jgi:hypothetical protein
MSDDRLLEDRQTFPLTRQQFDRLWSRVQRRMAWVLGVGFVTFILAMLLTGPAMMRAGIASDSIWRGLPAIVVILVAFFVFVWLCQDPRLRCPNCKQSLVGGMSPYIVIVTGRCPKCAATLFEDEAAASAQQSAEVKGATLLTQAELLAAERGVRRPAAPGTMKWVLTGAILLALGGPRQYCSSTLWLRASARSGRLSCSLFFSLRESRLDRGRLPYGVETWSLPRDVALTVPPRLHRVDLPPSPETVLDAASRP